MAVKKNVPELRFSEFSGEWEEDTLNNMLEFKNGINASREQYGKGIKFINVLDILNNDYITYEKIIGKVDIDKVTLGNNLVGYGDILFQRSSETREEVGTANVYLDNKEAVFGGFVIRGKKIGEYDPVFMNKLLKTSRSRKEITTKSGGSTRYNVSQGILEDVAIIIPSLPEQTKIANFFTLIDEKIEKQQDKVTNLEDYKKGMMQKIFSQEIRFKDGNGEDYPEWEEKKLEDIGSFYNGLSGKSKDDFIEGNKKYITYMNVFSNPIAELEMANMFKMGKSEKQNKVNYGDILFTQSSETIEEVGMSSVWLGNEEIYLNSFCFGYRLNSMESIVPSFIGYLLRTDIMRQRITIEGQGSTRFNLASSRLSNVYIFLPLFLEQQKIVNFLSIIDFKIEKEKEKLDSVKELKNGLMQKMFV